MIALSFQTGGRHHTSPVSLGGRGGGGGGGGGGLKKQLMLEMDVNAAHDHVPRQAGCAREHDNC